MDATEPKTSDPEIRHSRISVIVHLLAGFSLSLISITLANNLYSGILGLAVLAALSFVMFKKARHGIKWILSNGTIIYLFSWLVGWVVLFNL